MNWVIFSWADIFLGAFNNGVEAGRTIFSGHKHLEELNVSLLATTNVLKCTPFLQFKSWTHPKAVLWQLSLLWKFRHSPMKSEMSPCFLSFDFFFIVHRNNISKDCGVISTMKTIDRTKVLKLLQYMVRKTVQKSKTGFKDCLSCAYYLELSPI